MLINEFEAYCREQLGLSKHSLRAYRQDLSAFAEFALINKSDEKTDQQDIIAYQKHLREQKCASPATIRRRLVTLRSYFAWVETRDPFPSSPFRGLRLDMKVPKRLPRPVDRPTLATVFRASPHLVSVQPGSEAGVSTGYTAVQVTGLASRLLVVTGLRIGELTSLKNHDISGAATRIRVRGKGDRERVVYVTNQRLLMDFQRYWHQRLHTAGPSGWLFVNARDNQLTAQTFRKRLRAASSRLHIAPHLTPHQFRHSAATMLIEEGVDIRLVQRLLGHASIATTELYTKVSDNSLVAAVTNADTLAQVDQ